MPFKPDEREYREMPLMAAPADENAKKLPGDCYVEGYATTYNQPYSLGNWDGTEYFEQVDPAAFRDADMSDVIFQYDHCGRVLARQSNETLILDENDPHGLFVAADLSKSNAGKDIYDDIKAGLCRGMSWAFTVDEDSYDISTHTRTIRKIRKVYDVSAVSIPANPATNISARSYCERRAAEAREASAKDLAQKTLDRARAEALAILSL